MSKQKLIIFIDWFTPAFKAGGPVQSIQRLATELASSFSIYIVAGNKDVDGTVLDVRINSWVENPDGYKVIYVSEQFQNKIFFSKLIAEVAADCYYVNGIFSFKFSITPLLILKSKQLLGNTVVAPRGMLGQGALQIKSLKKKVFLKLVQIYNVPKNVKWHSTALEESVDIKKAFGAKIDIVQVPNFPRVLVAKEKNYPSNTLRLFFYSRISEKKNLKAALLALKEVKEKDIEFSIYGPIEDENYWKDCEEIITQLPAQIAVVYKGPIAINELTTVLSNEDVLLLPTLNENYGHAIVECLFCGCAVIISDQTPWKDVTAFGAGFTVGVNDTKAMAGAIDFYAKMSLTERALCSKKAMYYISNKVNLEEIGTDYITLFNDCAKNRSK